MNFYNMKSKRVPKMKVYCIEGRGFSSNTYILENNGEAFIFDPSAKEKEISDVLDKIGATPVAIVLTHGHFDHTLALSPVREKYNVPVMIHTKDNEMLGDSDKNAGKLRIWKKFDNIGYFSVKYSATLTGVRKF